MALAKGNTDLCLLRKQPSLTRLALVSMSWEHCTKSLPPPHLADENAGTLWLSTQILLRMRCDTKAYCHVGASGYVTRIVGFVHFRGIERFVWCACHACFMAPHMHSRIRLTGDLQTPCTFHRLPESATKHVKISHKKENEGCKEKKRHESSKPFCDAAVVPFE